MSKSEKLVAINAIVTKAYQESTSQESENVSRRLYEELLRKISDIIKQ